MRIAPERGGECQRVARDAARSFIPLNIPCPFSLGEVAIIAEPCAKRDFSDAAVAACRKK
jgi:hypothetical protein